MRRPPEPDTADRGHVIRLDPTVKQAEAMARACGVSRFTWNWALAEWDRQYKAGECPTPAKLKFRWNSVKRDLYPWVLESPRDANSQPFADLGRAFANYFASLKGERRGRKIQRPQFKRKGVHDSFYVANDKFECHSRGKRGVVRLPVIGNVKTFEALRFRGKILSGRVFRQAGWWYLSVNVETRVKRPESFPNEIVGVDLGLKTAVVCSDGAKHDAPKPLRQALRQLRRVNRQLHRRKKGGCNRRKSQLRVARIHQRVGNIRKDFLHKITSKICRENQAVVIEDLNVDGMVKNRRLSRAVSDVGLGSFRPLCEYKARGRVIVADRWFPSSRRCSRCGNVRVDLSLSERIYRCDKCGLTIDRDLNAALNLMQYPRLQGNWGDGNVARTPTETSASARRTRVRRASRVDEVGTRTEVLRGFPS